MLVEENSKKRGRPIRGIKKRNKDIHVRTTDDTFNKLENQYKLTVNGYNVL